MNTRKLLVSVLMLACVLLSACAPAATPIATSIPSSPTTEPMSTSIPVPASDFTKDIGKIVATIPMKYGDDTFAVGAGAIWIAHADDGWVSRVDPATNTVVAQIQISGAHVGVARWSPADIVVVNDQVWVTALPGAYEGELALIDPSTNQVVEHIPLGELEYPNGKLPFVPYALATDGTSLWVSDFIHNGIARVDLQTKQVTTKILGVEHVTQLLPDSNVIWAVLHRNDSLARIDPKTNSVVQTISLPPGGKGPDTTCGWCIGAMAIGDGSAWVSLGLGNAIAKVDLATNQVVATIDLEAGLAFDQGHLWATISPDNCDNRGGYLTRIDPKTNAIEGKIPLDCPGGIAVGENSFWIDTTSHSNQYAIVRIQPNP
jgi:hypothetical protein